MSALILAWIGTACWVVCFWWMHLISSKQKKTLDELHRVTKRIEEMSREEHQLIREVHPQVGEIKEKMDNVADAVAPQSGGAK